ncbi:glutamate:gamma-aminobutyrate antiporter [Ligilactobacillus cholophilus]|uniref:glutamate:gamma-aminobutyrate antiporter n=1 Tax=Ligilactobacillus cholophilus TaxID=3050131 RepID=UPI0025AF9BF5|nr:glutamate:gamma-aminobutyrate antiporter [Ligilactobacillus cholophilus]
MDNSKQSKNKPQKILGLFGFFALTSSMVLTVYEYPTFATSKLSLIFFTILGGLFWFLPTALVSAEMASVDGWEDGGVYSWVGNSLGKRWGFAAIFFQWFQITVGFVTMDYFIMGALSIVFDWPALNTNPFIKFFGVLILFWLLTFIQMSGTKYTAKIAKVGFVSGILIPSIIFFGLSIAYIVQGNPLKISFNINNLIPNFTKISTLVIFTSFILAFTGIEASASHVNELKNASHNYPLAIIMLVILAITLDGLGGISVAAVVPQKDLSLSAGVIQAFKLILLHFNSHLMWLVKILSLAIVFGVIAEISSWIIGPSRGMYVSAQQGLLPKIFRKVNKHGVPYPLLILQGIVVTIWDAVLTFGGGSDNVSFLAAVSLTVVIYLVCYLLMFISYFVLIYKKKKLHRTYNVPGGTVGKTLFALSGLLTSVFAFIVSFATPSALPAKDGKIYQIVLISSFVIALIVPFVIYAFRKFYGSKNENFKIKHFSSKDVNKFVHPAGRGEHYMEHELKNKK